MAFPTLCHFVDTSSFCIFFPLEFDVSLTPQKTTQYGAQRSALSQPPR